MAYFPVVGRLNCGSTPEEHEGFWQLDGFGIMAIYKSDWERFGGKSYLNFLHVEALKLERMSSTLTE